MSWFLNPLAWVKLDQTSMLYLRKERLISSPRENNCTDWSFDEFLVCMTKKIMESMEDHNVTCVTYLMSSMLPDMPICGLEEAGLAHNVIFEVITELFANGYRFPSSKLGANESRHWAEKNGIVR